MKILVLADSHADVESMLKAAEHEKADLILHLGDCISDALALEEKINAPLYYIAGNSDNAGADLYEKYITICGKRFLLIHGHQFKLADENADMLFDYLSDMIDYGIKGGAEIVLFGHTHRPFLYAHDYLEDEQGSRYKNIWLFNPGTSRPKRRGKAVTPTYGLIYLTEDYIKFEIVQMNL